MILDIRDRLPWFKQRLFDIAVRATMAYAAQREATKAAFVRVLDPTRQALAELARRSTLAHADFFLLTIDEVPAVINGHGPADAVITERRERRDYLQARIPPFWFVSPLSSPGTWPLRAGTEPPGWRGAHHQRDGGVLGRRHRHCSGGASPQRTR